ncbi:MAG: nucleotidyl transferase AbiEii/AbiGii toxin family protein [Cyclobacteriaceae bacterium]|nr:nucleotidyl transferase AbiEii/AbiGii toxin family protein [Cyclobacteriaceae bacterium]
MIRPHYHAQVNLLLTLLPQVAKEESFALKGGTAINLFGRDMPRLSVDIDLTYVNWQDDRTTALRNISEALSRIEGRLKATIPGIAVTRVPRGQGEDVKLNCQTPQATVKIEVNTTTRGTIFPVRLMPVSEAVQNEFQKFAAIQVVSQGELFGGKICAALDRQHPRDFFDVYHLFLNEGITEEIKLGFITFLISHARPMSELIKPHYLDQRAAFENQFTGMTATPFFYRTFEAVRERLLVEVNDLLTVDDRKFLLSFKKGTPQWNLVPIENLQRLPAVKWKLLNIQTLISTNPIKHKAMLKTLEEAVS